MIVSSHGVIGFLVGIVVSIVYWQHALARKKRFDEESNIIQCIFSEITTLEMFSERILSESLDMDVPVIKEPIKMDENYHAVFDAYLPLFSRISSNEVKHNIIYTYMTAKSLADTIRINNDILVAKTLDLNVLKWNGQSLQFTYQEFKDAVDRTKTSIISHLRQLVYKHDRLSLRRFKRS